MMSLMPCMRKLRSSAALWKPPTPSSTFAHVCIRAKVSQTIHIMITIIEEAFGGLHILAYHSILLTHGVNLRPSC